MQKVAEYENIASKRARLQGVSQSQQLGDLAAEAGEDVSAVDLAVQFDFIRIQA
jgi:hypothetical protein